MNLKKVQDPKARLDRESLLARLANSIRRCLELPEILSAAVCEVRSFLETDRIKIYKFARDGSGEVVAESINNNRLPSLLGLHFPADDIPPQARELFVQVQVRSIVDVDSGQLGQSPRRDPVSGNLLPDEVRYRPLDPCHAEYLSALGVKSSLVVPIFHGENLWGLLVSHHSESRIVAEQELQGVQMVADQLGIAIAQSTLLAQSRAKAQRETALNRVAAALHSQPAVELQAALEEAVAAFEGAGGRLYIFAAAFDFNSNNAASLARRSENSTASVKLYTCGSSPPLQALAKYPYMEQYSLWHEYFKSGDRHFWAIPDLYKNPGLRNLQPAFRSTKIRGILIVPLEYRQQILGYLSIFREEFETETLWAGQLNTDARLVQARTSFEVWKELKTVQSREWTAEEIELAQNFACHFASAIHQQQLHQQIQAANAHLENQVQERTAKLEQANEQQRALFDVVAKMRESLDLKLIFSTVSQEVRRALKADRVGVYCFDPESEFNEGEFVSEDVLPDFTPAMAVKVRDRCFGETYAHLYSQGRVHAVSDISQVGLQDCFRKILEQFQVKANLVAPVIKGNELWGLLCVHQCSGPRNWEPSEIQFATQVSAQLCVALQQADLLAQTQQQAVDLRRAAQQQRMLFEVVAKIRKSLDLDKIFSTTAREMRRIFNADRVGIYRFDPDSNLNEGEFITEDVIPNFTSAMTVKVRDKCFGEKYADKYTKGRIKVVADIDNAGLLDCHTAVLAQFQIKAHIVIPLTNGSELWGLLCIHSCSKPRDWKSHEIQFATQVGTQLSVALEQADLLAKTRSQAEQLALTLKNLQQTQSQLIQTEKMSSLGQLVAGVAHEINNPVNFIYGNLNHATEYTENLLSLLELYRQQYPDSSAEIDGFTEEIDLEFLASDLPKLLSSMKVGADRIRQIVLSLRNFSRLDEAEMKPVDIHEGIDSTLLILQHRLKAKSDSPNISIVKEYGNLPKVECYAGQLNQVFMNVLGNAIDALESDKQIKLNSSTYEIKISTAVGKINGKVPSAAIRIADNGQGIPDSVKERIFDPFFTTKPMGKGTGLGLSISYQIVVEKHGGVFKCSSELGKGSEFWIEIPLAH